MGRRSGFNKRHKDGTAGLAGGANNATRTFSSGEVYEGGGGGSYFADSVPVGYWNMEDGSGATVSDVSSAGNSLDGTRVGTSGDDGPDWDSVNKVRGSYSLAFDDGSGNNVQIEDNDALDFNTTDAFSISCWIKRDTLSGMDSTGGLVTKMAQFGQGDDVIFEGYSLYLGSSQEQPAFLLYRQPSTAQQLRVTGGPSNLIEDLNWHHIVATYNGDPQLSGVKIYFDGEALTTALVTDNLGPEDDIVNSTKLCFGAFINQTTPEPDTTIFEFSGNMDEIAIFSKELSAEEVTALYNEGNGNDLTNGIPSA